MNYYNKYIKYKSKYNKLKNQIGGYNTKCEKLLDADIIKYKSNQPQSDDSIIKTRKNMSDVLEEIKKYNDEFFTLIKDYGGSNKILSNYEIINIINDIDLTNIHSFYDKILINKYNLNYYVIKNLFITENVNEYLFFIKIYSYYSNNYPVFILGDSLYKIKKMHDFITNTDIDNVIKFSGNMFGENIDKLDDTYIIPYNENIMEFYEENKKFINIIFDSLNNLELPKIIIFDFSLKGFSLLTFIECLKKINDEKLHIYYIDDIETKIKNKLLFISFVMFTDSLEDIIKNIGQPKEKLDYILFSFNDLDTSFISHFINSDRTNASQLCSRCVPKYEPKQWKTPEDIFIDITDENESYKNYLGCNLNSIYVYIFIHYLFKSTPVDINNIKLINEIFHNVIYGDADNILILNNKLKLLKHVEQTIMEENELNLTILNSKNIYSFNGKYILSL
jgi:hypothetical protein